MRINYKFLLPFIAFLIVPGLSHAEIDWNVGGCAGPVCGSVGTGDGGIGGGGGGIGGALCEIVSWFNGPVGSAIASLAVIFLGISAFFGKVNWGTAILFAAGIFAIFGAPTIVASIVPSGSGFGSCG